MLALYIHWPFCAKKCPYCDFNSHIAQETPSPQTWLKAYISELDHYITQLPPNPTFDTIFFGGGTPSLMDSDLVAQLLSHLNENGLLAKNAEITLEANPHSVEWKKFNAFSQAGINRVSIGIQALNNDDLHFLGRLHSKDDALNAIQAAQDHFPRYNLDFIYARPKQSLQAWEDELHQALSLANGHLSLYQLTIEKGTPFYQQYQRGEFTLPDDDTLADIYERTEIITQAHNYHSYEISNYARPGHECQHNLHYWRYDDYIGIGPGAHSRYVNTAGQRIASHTIAAPQKWLNSIEEKQHGILKQRTIQNSDAIAEMLMMSLRLREGVDKACFEARFGMKIQQAVSPERIAHYINTGFMKDTESHLALTQQGRMVLNSLLEQLL